ncbi:MAG: CBS domain-containing protein [Parvibaculales bacterium]
MSIKAILNNKGADVIAIDGNQTVREALRVMARRQIGALVVAGGGDGCQGIFTERDVMRALAEGDAAILDDALSRHMTPRPQSISPETSVDEAMEIMTEKRFRHLPVMRDDVLCGIVSIGDLVNFRINQTELEAQALRDYIKTG